VKRLFVEIADTPYKREIGLMKRKNLDKNSGMLFRFKNSNNLSFWMKDTYIPLDIAFLNDSGKILQIEEMIPLSTRAISSKYPCRYALEVNRDWFKDNGIGVGSVMGGKGLLKNINAQSNIFNQVPTGQTQQKQVAPEPNPDVMMDLSFKDKIKGANDSGKDLIIMYQTKDGFGLPPKSISPPFTFEKDSDGKHDAIVKAWDNQVGEWRSFIIDNIISLEEKK